MRRRERRRRVEEGHSRGAGMGRLIALLALAFMVTLGVVIGTRMSSDAIAVLVGVVAGVAASIPCALLLMAVTRRREREEAWEEEPRYRASRAGPPVIVVTPGTQPQQLPYGLPYGGMSQLEGGRRKFRVMGYEEEEEPAIEGDGRWVE